MLLVGSGQFLNGSYCRDVSFSQDFFGKREESYESGGKPRGNMQFLCAEIKWDPAEV